MEKKYKKNFSVKKTNNYFHSLNLCSNSYSLIQAMSVICILFFSVHSRCDVFSIVRKWKPFQGFQYKFRNATTPLARYHKNIITIFGKIWHENIFLTKKSLFSSVTVHTKSVNCSMLEFSSIFRSNNIR